jgi:hypothetical protein
MAAPLLNTKQQIAIKQEAAAGTPIALAAADVIIHTGIAEYEVDAQITDREFNSATLSPRGSVIGAISATIRFKMYMRGTVGVPVDPTNLSDLAVPFKGCGVNAVVAAGETTYKPSSTLIVDDTSGGYCTVALYEDGRRYSIAGAQGNCKLTFERGAPGMAEFEFKGIYIEPTDAALLVPTYPAVVEPPFLGASMTVLTYGNAIINTLTLDFGNEVVMRPDPNDASGYFSGQIVSRKPTGTIDPEEVLAATKNWWNEWTVGTTGAITTGTWGGAAENQFNLTIPKAAYRSVNRDNRDGIAIAPIDFDCRANTDAGDDEWNLLQT